MPLLRVLLAEDHPLVRDVVSQLLSAYCVVVGYVDRGDAVAGAVQCEHPDVLLTDISMPGRNGIQVLREVRKASPALVIVVLSSHDSKAYRETATTYGADGYVTKMNAATELWPSIQAAVSHRTMQQAGASQALQAG